MLIPHIAGDAALIRHSRSDKINGHLSISPSLVILAGNGAIDNGSKPLINALQDCTGRAISENASASVAAVLAQSFRGRKNFALKDIEEIVANMGSIDVYLQDYYKFKAAIANYFQDYYEAGNIRLRESSIVLQQLGNYTPDNVGVITTNWDECIWESSYFENVIQLHGLAVHPESIVLPGEYATDEDLAEILDNHGLEINDEALRHQVQRMFRGEFMRPIAASLQTALSWLSNARTVVVWGLGFHAYDSEVCQLAWEAFNPSNIYCANRSVLRKIIIINPSVQHREMCKYLFGNEHIEYVEFDR